MEGKRERGTVIFFNPTKGWGFLKRPNASDIFCHWSAIVGQEGYKQLKPDEIVEFEVIQGAQGPQAANVRVVE